MKLLAMSGPMTVSKRFCRPLRKGVAELCFLPAKQPTELRGILRNGAAQRGEVLGRKQLDHFRPMDGKRIVISGIENAQRSHALRMGEREVDRRRPRRIMRDRDDRIEAQYLHDRFEIAELLLETVGRAGEFVGGAEAQEIENDYTPPAGDQIRGSDRRRCAGYRGSRA